ncbi:hypothetical protein A4X06_0g1236 [Tilletia controversa]|uniref:Uncharacterized protein n=1 Tax=Tilletia controversa TaxID=13291 RepID=A0A8X7MXW7_9BASI|nr:hypothetical protein A4X06_0g1236 [Tilletia controversa]
MAIRTPVSSGRGERRGGLGGHVVLGASSELVQHLLRRYRQRRLQLISMVPSTLAGSRGLVPSVGGQGQRRFGITLSLAPLLRSRSRSGSGSPSSLLFRES